MRYKPKNLAALRIALGGLPDKMRVEADRGVRFNLTTDADFEAFYTPGEADDQEPTEAKDTLDDETASQSKTASALGFSMVDKNTV